MNRTAVFKSSIIILVISNLANVLQYLIQIYLGRALSPSAFGVYNTMNAIFVVMMAFSMAISFVTAREIINLGNDAGVLAAFISDLLKKTACLSAGFIVVFFLFAKNISHYFSIDNEMPVYLCGAIMAGLTLQSVFTGILQGRARYLHLSYVLVYQNAIRFFAILVIVSVFHLSYNGALSGVLISYVLIVFYYLHSLRAYIRPTTDKSRIPDGIYRALFQGTLPLSLMWTYMGIVSHIDIPLVKHFSTEYATGLYSAGSVLGRIAWFLPSMLVYVLFPEVVRNDSQGKSSALNVLVIAAITLLVSFGIAGFFYFFPSFTLTLLLGSKYVDAKPVLIIVSISMAILAMLSVFYNFCLAKKLTFFLFPAYAILFAGIALIMYNYHSQPIEIASVLLGVLILTAVVNIGQFIVKFWYEITSRINVVRQSN